MFFGQRICDAHSNQIPRSIHHFVDIEAGVDGGNNLESGSKELDASMFYSMGSITLTNTNHTDDFIDDRVHGLDRSVPPHHVSWQDLPDWEEGLGDLLNRIL